MQRKDAVTGRFLENKERFADIMNVGCFEGEEIIKPERLKDVDRTSRTIIGDKKSNRKKAVTKYCDIVKETEIGMSRIILAIKNQSKIHYAMSVRVMTMDAFDVMTELTGHSNLSKIKEDKMVKNNEMRGEIDMKDALAELIEDLAEERAEKLAEENEQKKVISHIQKNLAKNRSAEDIADFLGEDIKYVKEIENIVSNNPKYMIDEIYEESKKLML